jgi:ABC-type antimicrobial peptide transport system permease subunit
VLRLVLARGVFITSIGVGGGLVLATAMTAFLASVLLGVRPFDVPALTAAAALLGAVALLASWWPARWAMRVDPMITLKDSQ